MKFLMYSQCGEGSQILQRIQSEGNDCALFIKDKIYKTIFDGILKKTDNPESFIDKDTTIIFDMSGNGSYADSLRRKGHYIWGASSFADDLEHDRQFGFDAMNNAGIMIPEHKEFKSFKDGLNYVKQSEQRLVFKPSGSMPCKLTYCSQDSEELLAYMPFVEQHFGKDIDSFILQDFIEGVVVSSEVFSLGDKGFIGPYNHTVEVKKSMNNELGPSTGCSGNIVWVCENDRIITEGLSKIEDLCKKHDYIGPIDLNAVVNEQGVYGLEWTPRFGYDATPTLLYGLTEDFGKIFSDLARKQCSELPLINGYIGGIRLSIPPYPAEPKQGIDSEKFSPNKGVPIQNWEDHEANLFFYEVCVSENQELCHSGGTGVIACAIGEGDTPEKSLELPEKILEEIILPDKQYRTDLTSVLSKLVKEAETHGN